MAITMDLITEITLIMNIMLSMILVLPVNEVEVETMSLLTLDPLPQLVKDVSIKL